MRFLFLFYIYKEKFFGWGLLVNIKLNGISNIKIKYSEIIMFVYRKFGLRNK